MPGLASASARHGKLRKAPLIRRIVQEGPPVSVSSEIVTRWLSFRPLSAAVVLVFAIFASPGCVRSGIGVVHKQATSSPSAAISLDGLVDDIWLTSSPGFNCP